MASNEQDLDLSVAYFQEPTGYLGLIARELYARASGTSETLASWEELLAEMVRANDRVRPKGKFSGVIGYQRIPEGGDRLFDEVSDPVAVAWGISTLIERVQRSSGILYRRPKDVIVLVPHLVVPQLDVITAKPTLRAIHAGQMLLGLIQGLHPEDGEGTKKAKVPDAVITVGIRRDDAVGQRWARTVGLERVIDPDIEPLLETLPPPDCYRAEQTTLIANIVHREAELKARLALDLTE